MKTIAKTPRERKLIKENARLKAEVTGYQAACLKLLVLLERMTEDGGVRLPYIGFPEAVTELKGLLKP